VSSEPAGSPGQVCGACHARPALHWCANNGLLCTGEAHGDTARVTVLTLHHLCGDEAHHGLERRPGTGTRCPSAEHAGRVPLRRGRTGVAVLEGQGQLPAQREQLIVQPRLLMDLRGSGGQSCPAAAGACGWTAWTRELRAGASDTLATAGPQLHSAGWQPAGRATAHTWPPAARSVQHTWLSSHAQPGTARIGSHPLNKCCKQGARSATKRTPLRQHRRRMLNLVRRCSSARQAAGPYATTETHEPQSRGHVLSAGQAAHLLLKDVKQLREALLGGPACVSRQCLHLAQQAAARLGCLPPLRGRAGHLQVLQALEHRRRAGRARARRRCLQP